MYPEFIAIYAGLAVILVLLVVILILQIKILRGGGRASGAPKHQINSTQKSVVFCKNCAARFNASERVCPKCGTPR